MSNLPHASSYKLGFRSEMNLDEHLRHLTESDYLAYPAESTMEFLGDVLVGYAVVQEFRIATLTTETLRAFLSFYALRVLVRTNKLPYEILPLLHFYDEHRLDAPFYIFY